MAKENQRSPYLKIRQVRISGQCHRNLSFNDGINIIEGDNGLGKTTLLRLLQFGLGLQKPIQGSEWKKSFIPKLADSKKVVLEIEINGQIISLDREINQKNDIAIVSESEIDAVFRRENIYNIKGRELSDYLLSRLNIPLIEIQSEIGILSKTIFLIFDYLFHLMYLDQDVGYVKVGNTTLRESVRVPVTELLLGIINASYYEFEISEQLERNRKELLSQQLKHIQQFFSGLNVMTIKEIGARKGKLLQDQSTFEQQIAKLKLEMRANPDYRSDLREDVIQLDRELEQLEIQQIELQQSLSRYELAEASVKQERERVERTSHARTILKQYHIEVCPGCNQKITREMHTRRLEDLCELCGRDLPELDEDAKDDELKWREKVLSDEAREIDDLRAKRIEEGKKLEVFISEKLQKRYEISNQLNMLQDQFVGDVINQIEEHRIRLNNNEKELSLLEFLEKANNSIEQIISEIAEIDTALKKIKEDKEKLQQSIDDGKAIVLEFQNGLSSFLNSVGFPDLGEIEIDENNYLPKFSGRSYDHLSATQRNLLILGYYYALLRVSLTQKTNFPRFLIIDTVRKDDIDRDTMLACLRKFQELDELFGVPYQVIIALREAPDEFKKYRRLQLHGDNYLLICD